MKTLCYCANSFEAHLIKGRLESNGIACCVINEHTHTNIPISSVIQNMSVQVVVDESDVEQALNILNEQIEPNDTSPSLCPECGSPDIKYGFFGSKCGVKKIVAILLLPFMALAGNMIGNVRNNYYCKKCKHEFKQ